MNIRPFKQSDLPEILDIYSNSKLDELVNENKKFSLTPLEEDEKRLKDLLESDIFVYEDKNIVGYGAVYGSEIRALFVHPNNRGKGIGKCLLEHLLTLIDHQAVLYVAKSNELAIGLYKKYGFQITDEFETTYSHEPVLANRMTRKIGNG